MKEPMDSSEKKKHAAIWQLLFGVIMALFIGILIAVYVIAKKANPIILDEKGRPLQSQGESHSY
ncbi:MAG: hypothetical protein JSS81_05695 [Acidobacteria bacterium]|nr:hypothetical protein [Acidobacteriota bacterium]